MAMGKLFTTMRKQIYNDDAIGCYDNAVTI